MKKELDREELKDVVISAYHGAKMDEQDKARIKENLLKKNKAHGRWKMSYKAVAGIVAVFVFVIVNVAIIGLNLKHEKQVENLTVDGTEENVQKNSLFNVGVGDVIFSMQVTPYVIERFSDGGYSTKIKNYTAQVVVREIAVTDSEETNTKLNNDNIITGSFDIQIVDEKGNVISSCALSTGATSEYGVSIDLDSESLLETFGKGDYSDMIIFRHPTGEENGQKRYLTSFYGVDENGMIFLYEVDEQLPQDVCAYSDFELMTSENFSMVVNEPGLWQDYCVFADKNIYIFYNFDVNEKKIKPYQVFEGADTGKDVDAALAALQINYDFLGFTGRIPLESEVIVETVINGNNETASVGYKQVDKDIATTREELLDYIENSVTNLSIYGFSSREELSDRLFVEPIDLFFVDKSKLQEEDIPPYKMIDGKLCYCYVYRGAPLGVSNRYVAQKIDDKNTDFYCKLSGVDSIEIVRVRMVLCDDGVWRAKEFERIDLVTQRDGVVEKILYTTQADMDNDGIDDYIVTSLQCSMDTDMNQEVETLLREWGALLYVKIYKGTGNDPQVAEGKYYGLECLWWHEYASARPGHGQVTLVQKDAKNYILVSTLTEMQDRGWYEYGVYDLSNPDVVVDEYQVEFVAREYVLSTEVSREDVVPEFRQRIESWFSDAILLVAIDYTYNITTDGNILTPEVYYDTVWGRKD